MTVRRGHSVSQEQAYCRTVQEGHRADSLLSLVPLVPGSTLYTGVCAGFDEAREGPSVAARSATVRTPGELLRVGLHSVNIPEAGENQLLLISGHGGLLAEKNSYNFMREF